MAQITIMTGEEHRRKRSRTEWEQIIAAAFAPGAVVAKVARHCDMASSLIYTWRGGAHGVAPRKTVGFSPAILIEQAKEPASDADALVSASSSSFHSAKPVAPIAITLEFSAEVQVAIDAEAPTALLTAPLPALQ